MKFLTEIDRMIMEQNICPHFWEVIDRGFFTTAKKGITPNTPIIEKCICRVCGLEQEILSESPYNEVGEVE